MRFVATPYARVEILILEAHDTMNLMLALAWLLCSQATISLPPLDTYDAKGVGNVVFGRSTDKELKKAFKVGKGAMRPEGLVLSSDDQWRVDALLDGRGGDAKAIGLWFEAKRTKEANDLTKDLGSSETLYAMNRSSDWAVQAYPERGIALFVVHQGTRDFVEGVLLTDKDRILQLARGLKDSPTEEINLNLIFNQKDRRVFVQSFDLHLSRKNIDVGDVRREERLLEDFARRRAMSRNILMDRVGDGRVSITVDIDFEKTNVSASLNGSNEVGAISGSGSASAKFNVANDVAYYRRDRVEDAVLEALDEAFRAGERAISKQRPPTAEEDRKQMVYSVINSGVR